MGSAKGARTARAGPDGGDPLEERALDRRRAQGLVHQALRHELEDAAAGLCIGEGALSFFALIFSPWVLSV
jgi:hypothetical protein